LSPPDVIRGCVSKLANLVTTSGYPCTDLYATTVNIRHQELVSDCWAGIKGYLHSPTYMYLVNIVSCSTKFFLCLVIRHRPSVGLCKSTDNKPFLTYVFVNYDRQAMCVQAFLQQFRTFLFINFHNLVKHC
jgi:hypothetical protein